MYIYNNNFSTFTEWNNKIIIFISVVVCVRDATFHVSNWFDRLVSASEKLLKIRRESIRHKIQFLFCYRFLLIFVSVCSCFSFVFSYCFLCVAVCFLFFWFTCTTVYRPVWMLPIINILPVCATLYFFSLLKYRLL